MVQSTIIRIVIADHSSFIAESFPALFDARDNVYVEGHVSQEDELHFLLPHCDVALISAHFKATETDNLIRDLSDSYRNIKLIIVGVPDVPAQIVRFLEAGAAGYVLKTECGEDLLRKVRMAVNGRALISDRVALFMMKRIHELAQTRCGEESEQSAQLTHRQQEVIALVGDGLTNREIANTLDIECGTVKNHVHHILKKLNASNRHEAASIYQECHPATRSTVSRVDRSLPA